MDHFISKLRIKTIDADQRIIEGWATTNAVDRAGDIVEPEGAEFDLIDRPIPLLLDHKHSEIIGEIEAAEVTPRGIKFRARVFKIDVPGLAKDYLDKAWHMLKAGARKFVSIGFRALDWENLPGGAARYTKWEWLELSCCAVPMNPQAKITGAKRAPRQSRPVKVAKPAHRVVKLDSPIRGAVSHGHSKRPGVVQVKLTDVDKIKAEIRRQSDIRRAARRRAGIPEPVVVVKLTAEEMVEAICRRAREKRALAKIAGRRSGVVSLR